VATKLDGATVNGTKLLVTPFCCTYAFPGITFAGTVTTICVSLQLTTDGYVLYSATSPLLPSLAPNPLPVIVICPPGVTCVGEMLVITGVWPKSTDGNIRQEQKKPATDK
jgi:hypothetical protein